MLLLTLLLVTLLLLLTVRYNSTTTMPQPLPILQHYKNFRGKTSSGKDKWYSVCMLCGFSNDDHIEANILDCGKLGSTRTQAKYYHLKDNCEKARELGIQNKYDKNGHEIQSSSQSNRNQSNSNKFSSNQSNPILKFSFVFVYLSFAFLKRFCLSFLIVFIFALVFFFICFYLFW